MKKITAVATLYKSPETIVELVNRLESELQSIVGSDYEILLVDDGCPMGSGESARGLLDEKPNLRVLTLSRNFGQHKAIMAGLSLTESEYVFLLDGDLEEDPEILSLFWKELSKTKADVIYGLQSKGRRGHVDRVVGNFAYGLINMVSGVKVPPNVVTARLMSRRYVNALVEHKDQVPWLAGLWVLTGFTQLGLEIKKQKLSQTSYSLSNRFRQLAIAITFFSTRPIRILAYLGLVSFFLGLLGAFWAVANWANGTVAAGWTSTLISIWVLGGANLMAIGIVGFYVGNILVEVKNRPYVVVASDSAGQE